MGGRHVVLDLLLEPVVGIRNVAGVDQELVVVQLLRQRGNGGLLVDPQRVGRARPDDGAQPESAKRALLAVRSERSMVSKHGK